MRLSKFCLNLKQSILRLSLIGYIVIIAGISNDREKFTVNWSNKRKQKQHTQGYPISLRVNRVFKLNNYHGFKLQLITCMVNEIMIEIYLRPKQDHFVTKLFKLFDEI